MDKQTNISTQEETPMKTFIVDIGGKEFEVEANDENDLPSIVDTIAEKEGLSKTKQPKQDTSQPSKLTIEELLSGAYGKTKLGQVSERMVVDGIIAPLTEFTRGLYEGTGGFYNKLDAVQKLEETAFPGLETLRDITKTGDIFSNFSKMMYDVAEDMPETNMSPVTKSVYQFMGGAIPALTEFALVNKLTSMTGIPNVLNRMGPGWANLANVEKYAIYNTISDLANNPETTDIMKSLKTGAMVGMAFPIAFAGIEVVKNLGKRAGETFIHFITGKSSTAKDFVNNMWKYNTNPFGKVKTHDEIKVANEVTKKRLSNKYKTQQDMLKTRQEREAYLLKTKLDDNILKNKQIINDNKLALSSKQVNKVDQMTKTVETSIKDNQRVLSEKTVKVYDDALSKYTILKKQAGEQVDNAIKSTLEANPGAGISSKYMKSRWNNTINKYSPFKITQKAARTAKDPQGLIALAESKGLYQTPTKQVAERATAAGKKSDAQVFNDILQEFNKLSQQKDISIGYLQNLKSDLKTRSQQAYGSDARLGKFYSELSDAVNPAKAVSDNPNVTKHLKLIAEANKQYTQFLPKYDEAIKQYFKKDSQERLIPDIDKAVSAVRGQNTVEIRQMKLADSALPESDRILPKVQQIVKEQNLFNNQQATMIKQLKMQNKSEMDQFNRAANESMNRLRRSKANIMHETKQKTTSDLNSFVNRKQEEYNAIEDKLNKIEEFYHNQDLLRSFKASGQTLSSIGQRAGIYGTIGQAGLQKSIPGAGSAMFPVLGIGMAPIVGANLLKAASVVGTEPYRVLRALLGNKYIAEAVVGRKSSKKKAQAKK
jgi:hypothetical protein